MTEEKNMFIEDLRSRKEEALKKIYDTYWKRLYIYAYSITGDRHTAEDLVQEIFISLWEKSENTSIVHIEAYLFRGVKYRAINLLKQEKKKVSSEDALKLIPVEEGPEYHLAYQESQELLLKTMEKLPIKCRKVFYMSRIKGYNNREIAQEMGISVRTVETHISNALRFLRLHL